MMYFQHGRRRIWNEGVLNEQQQQRLRSLISYEGTTAAELISDFHGAVDDYLTLCREEGTEPEIAYKGSLNVRLGPELHRNAAIYAISHNQSLNSFIESAVREKLSDYGSTS